MKKLEKIYPSTYSWMKEYRELARKNSLFESVIDGTFKKF